MPSRIFIQDVKNQAWQLFSLEQNKRDGSIYLGSPEFTSFEWITFCFNDGNPTAFKVAQDKEGHLSIHGHGQAQIRNVNEKYQWPIRGQHLLRSTESEISLRHLVTIFPKRPEHVPPSEALKRKGDYIFQFNDLLQPFVMIAFALPRELNVHFKTSFDVERLNLVGTVKFPLVHHSILWVFYRTQFMDLWPKKTMLQYGNGVNVPLFFGEPDQMITVQFRQPLFSLQDKTITIDLSLCYSSSPPK